MPSSAPDPYPASYYYMGVSAQYMFKNGGNGAWGNIVKGCLVCMYNQGVPPSEAHEFCYVNGFSRTGFGPGLSGLDDAIGAAMHYYGQSAAGGIDSGASSGQMTPFGQ